MFPLQPQISGHSPSALDARPKPPAPRLTPMARVLVLEAGGMRIEAGGLEIRSLKLKT